MTIELNQQKQKILNLMKLVVLQGCSEVRRLKLAVPPLPDSGAWWGVKNAENTPLNQMFFLFGPFFCVAML